ncbi:MAG: UvrB/UvrC motif-containing protein, partial [Muribaculaceae bacterium]|nr:UvrB/UvrC motif-containing protein [Muribaculaceae bacterium]
IYTTKEILEETGFIMDSPDESGDNEHDENGETAESDELFNPDVPIERMSIEELERTLAHCIEKEDYEEAARVSELLRRKKEGLTDFEADNDTDISGFDL